jgi:hypothetical protein
MTILQLERFKINVIVLCFVIPNSVSEARVFFSARVGVRDLLFLFAIDLICENPVRHAACRTKSLRSHFVPFAPKSITRFRPLSSSTVPVPNLLCLTQSPIENTVSFSASFRVEIQAWVSSRHSVRKYLPVLQLPAVPGIGLRLLLCSYRSGRNHGRALRQNNCAGRPAGSLCSPRTASPSAAFHDRCYGAAHIQ